MDFESKFFNWFRIPKSTGLLEVPIKHIPEDVSTYTDMHNTKEFTWIDLNEVHELAKKKEEMKPKGILKKSRLVVKLSDGTIFEWYDWFVHKELNEVIPTWRKFYKWYLYGKSEKFVFVYDTGRTIFKRQDIMTICIHVDDRKGEKND